MERSKVWRHYNNTCTRQLFLYSWFSYARFVKKNLQVLGIFLLLLSVLFDYFLVGTDTFFLASNIGNECNLLQGVVTKKIQN